MPEPVGFLNRIGEKARAAAIDVIGAQPDEIVKPYNLKREVYGNRLLPELRKAEAYGRKPGVYGADFNALHDLVNPTKVYQTKTDRAAFTPGSGRPADNYLYYEPGLLNSRFRPMIVNRSAIVPQYGSTENMKQTVARVSRGPAWWQQKQLAYNGYPRVGNSFVMAEESKAHELAHAATSKYYEHPNLVSALSGLDPNKARYQFDKKYAPEVFPPMSAMQEWSFKQRGKRFESPGEFQAFVRKNVFDEMQGLSDSEAESFMTLPYRAYPSDMRRFIHSLRGIGEMQGDTPTPEQQKVIDIYGRFIPAQVRASNPNHPFTKTASAAVVRRDFARLRARAMNGITG